VLSLALPVLALGLATSAHAQDPGYAYAPPPEAPPPPPAPPPAGEWVNTPEYGMVWIPAGATAYPVNGAPYAYLYSPRAGWSWHVSPWGWGGYTRHVFVRRPRVHYHWAPPPRHHWRPAPPVVVHVVPRHVVPHRHGWAPRRRVYRAPHYGGRGPWHGPHRR